MKLRDLLNEDKYTELVKLAKKSKGFKSRGKGGFTVKTATGTMEVDKIYYDDKKLDVTWVSGGTTQDTDAYKIEQVISMIKNLQR